MDFLFQPIDKQTLTSFTGGEGRIRSDGDERNVWTRQLPVHCETNHRSDRERGECCLFSPRLTGWNCFNLVAGYLYLDVAAIKTSET